MMVNVFFNLIFKHTQFLLLVGTHRFKCIDAVYISESFFELGFFPIKFQNILAQLGTILSYTLLGYYLILKCYQFN